MADDVAVTEVSANTVTLDTNKKGLLNSATVRNIIFSLLSSLVGMGLTNVEAIQNYLLALAPDSLKLFVVPFVQFLSSALTIWFGKRAVDARVSVGDIKGLYRKTS